MEKPGVFSRIGAFITAVRNFILNAVFVLVLVVLGASLFVGEEEFSLAPNSALVLNPAGVLVEQIQPPAHWQDLVFQDPSTGAVSIQDVLRAIELARDDDNISLLVIDLRDLQGVTNAQAARVANAIDGFREQGKKVVAYGDYYDQNQYFIAASADEVYVHPMGQILLTGLGGNKLYFKEALDKLDINVHIFRVGDYKSATEPFSQNSMSDDARSDAQVLLGEVWALQLGDIAKRRGLELGAVRAYADQFGDLLDGAGGNMAQAALEANMVDDLFTRDQVRARIGEFVDTEDGELRTIAYNQYLASMTSPFDALSNDSPVVAVITVQGTIMDNGASGGNIVSADRIVDRIRTAEKNEQIQALVLRVDSPGGSVMASENIRGALEQFQNSGRPVVASFASIAASGGYWISATSDIIFAEPSSVTGSIGVFGILPTFERSLARLGVSTDGVGTTPLTTGMDSFSGLSPEVQRILQLNVESTYRQFIALVARGRNMPKEQIEEIAQGRVWSGLKAKELDLVNEIGSLDDAVASAAELAGLSRWKKVELLEPLDPQTLFMMQLMDTMGLSINLGLPPMVQHLNREWLALTALFSRRETFALCLTCSG
ncbi:MAG: signal peptide peptidase SppA [OM182 bacterium]|nr:MAG: signal peptide peptidase SppA [OM182 bacterium]